jgi:hypothetical protein
MHQRSAQAHLVLMRLSRNSPQDPPSVPITPGSPPASPALALQPVASSMLTAAERAPGGREFESMPGAHYSDLLVRTPKS